MGERYTLDTSAVIAYFADEPGARIVQELVSLNERAKAVVFVSFMTYMEVLYRLWQQAGERAGKLAYLRLRALGLRRLDVSGGLLLRASRIKATHGLSLADAWVAATALLTDSRLVHKDPEFRPLREHIALLELPLKPPRRRNR